MTKLGLLLGATTMLTSITGAMAASTSTVSIQMNSFCDKLNLTINGSAVGSVENASSCTADIMGGFEVKVKKTSGKFAFVGGPRFGSGSEAWGWLIQMPFKTGNTAYLYDTSNGVTYSLCCSSTYTVGGARVTKGLAPAGKFKQDVSNVKAPKTLKF